MREKGEREFSSYICNQVAGFNRCITKIQDSIQENLKALQSELSKGKSSVKAQAALDKLHYLTSFNQNVSFAVGKSLQHLSDFTFVFTWSLLGANPRVVSILKDAYIPLFKVRPQLVRDPLIISGYANPLRNLYLKEALHALIDKNAVERVRVRTSVTFFNRLFIVPKPNQKWRPILDLSALNQFLT